MYELAIEPLGQSVSVEEGQTLLDAALRAGVYLPHACGHGLCGTCKVQVLEGDIDQGAASSFALMDFEREEGLCLACCAIPESDITIEADIDEEPDAKNLPVHTVDAIVTELVDLTPTIKGVRLHVQGERAMDFQAGQYMNLHLPGGGHRPFSFANPPSEPFDIELDVRRVPGGLATSWIHDKLNVGDRVEVSGPYGRFHVRSSANLPMIFIAGGSGLSSPRSMILDLLEHGCELPITLIYGARNAAELYRVEEMNDLAAKFPNFAYVPVLSDEPAGTAWTGRRGFAHEAAKEHFDNDFRGHKVYLCGPPMMIDACITTLMQGRLFERDIYQELFVSAADSARARSPLFKKI